MDRFGVEQRTTVDEDLLERVSRRSSRVLRVVEDQVDGVDELLASECVRRSLASGSQDLLPDDQYYSSRSRCPAEPALRSRTESIAADEPRPGTSVMVRVERTHVSLVALFPVPAVYSVALACVDSSFRSRGHAPSLAQTRPMS